LSISKDEEANVVKALNEMEDERINELLSNVGRVDTPPFLFTRIEARVALQNEESPSRSWVLATGMTLALLFTMNTYFLLNSSKENLNGPIEKLAGSLELNASNQLYHD